jgi:glycosyltransferase involved in cell wall biosynthesis
LSSLSVLNADYGQLIVIDQSDGDASWRVAQSWAERIPQLTYLRHNEKNASSARNLAIERATGDIIAFLDDDCTVDPDWLDRVGDAFDQNPEAALIFGTVEAVPHDPTATLVPSYTPRSEKQIRGRLGAVQMGGIGAGMYLRRGSDRPLRLDVCLGPGSRFRNSEDWDFRYRMVASGRLIVETPEISVLHHGGRPYAGGSASVLVRDYLYGLGAAQMKLLRTGDLIMLGAIAAKLVESVGAIRPLQVMRRRPTRVGGLLMYLRGLRDSFRMPIDRHEKLYRVPAPIGAAPFITVAIPTCNRPHELDHCLASLSAVESNDWKVLVIDQSDNDHSRRVVEAWSGAMPQLEFLRLHDKNASAARNRAIDAAANGILAFLDDDCTVRPDWLDTVREAFGHEPTATLIFGAVIAADHDPAIAFVPAYQPGRVRRLHGSFGKLHVRGMGASMSLRLSSGTRPRFDLGLGPGARFRSSQDVDYTFRALAAGQVVVETPGIAVIHHGARSYADGPASVKWRDYLYGAGACHAKLLRCGQWTMVATIAGKLARSIGAIRPQNALRHRPTRFGLVLMYSRGLLDGLRAPVDRRNRVFL